MHRTLLAFITLTCCACSAGPSRPGLDDYRPTAVVIRAHFNGASPETPFASLALSFINRSADSTGMLYAGSATEAFREDGMLFEVPAGAAYYPQLSALPTVRFFTVAGSAYARDTGPTYLQAKTYWGRPGLFLVYALHSTPWTPWGPTGQMIEIPQGYSWLQVSCGSTPGQLGLESHPIDELVELVPLEGPAPGYWDGDVQLIEQSFVKECGAAIPDEDLGTRISFDTASALAWSPDNTQLYYLSAPLTQDPSKSAGLRRIRPSDSVDSELMTVAKGQGLQVDQSGTLFVGSDRVLLRVSTSPEVPPSVTTIPIAATFSSLLSSSDASPVSPDGRWVVFGPHYDFSIWDVQQGIDLETPSGSFAGWSPSGEMAYWSDHGTLAVASATGLGGSGKDFAMPRPFKSQVAWTAGGPVVVKVPGGWSEWGSVSFEGSSGLSLIDPSIGVERTILDTAIGPITLVPGSWPLDTAFVWAKNCLGLFDTVCSYALLRVTLTTGVVQTVAVSHDLVPVGISSDGRRLALGTSKGLYVKDLPQ